MPEAARTSLHSFDRPLPLRAALRAVPLGARLLPRLPERTTQRALGRALGRWPALWGLPGGGEYMGSARRAFQLAFPAEDADEFVTNWLTARGNALATSLDYMARWLAGRESGMVRLHPSFRLQGSGPFVVIVMHYSLEPVVQLACLAAHPDLSFRWPIYPLQPNIEDDRVLWLSRSELPPPVASTLLSIADPKWTVKVFAHLRAGGSLMMALDAPVDARRPANTTMAIGALRVPVAPTIELFMRVGGAQLVYAWPRQEPDRTWTLELVHVSGVEELAALAVEWILTQREEWAGWPYAVWRESSEDIRQAITVRGVPGRPAERPT